MTRRARFLSVGFITLLGAAVLVAARLGRDVEAPALVGAGPTDRSLELARVRQLCRTEPLDAFLAEQRALVERDPGDGAAWRVLAETHLERIYTRDLGRGLAVGRPLHEEIAPETARDVEAGLEAIARAIDAGEDKSDSYRIRASLLCCRITGMASAIAVQGKATAALERALELDPANPYAQVVLGNRKLFAPPLLGHDAEGALVHLRAGAAGLPHDERPLITAALAAHVLGDADEARRLVKAAVERTPANPLAAAIAARLEAGEEDPFGRDVE